jgi:hypothetical protein
MPQAQYQSPTSSVAGPTVNGRDLTVDFLLNNPTVIASRIANITAQRFLSPYIFRNIGGVQGGAVIYNRIDSNQNYLVRDLQTIAEGAEIPLVDAAEPGPLVVLTAKYGGGFEVTDEARRRNSGDVMTQMETKISNNAVLRQDRAAISMFNSDPLITAAVSGVGAASTGGTLAALALWSDRTNGDPITDITKAVSIIGNRELGYKANLVLTNPADSIKLIQNPNIRAALPRESAPGNPILNGELGRFLGLEWMDSNQVPQGTAYVLQRGIVGGIAEEVPLTMETQRIPSRQVTAVYATRTTGTFIDNPLAVIRVTGL